MSVMLRENSGNHHSVGLPLQAPPTGGAAPSLFMNFGRSDTRQPINVSGGEEHDRRLHCQVCSVLRYH